MQQPHIDDLKKLIAKLQSESDVNRQTLRDKFAMAVLPEVFATAADSTMSMARIAYQMADAMLQAREE